MRVSTCNASAELPQGLNWPCMYNEMLYVRVVLFINALALGVTSQYHWVSPLNTIWNNAAVEQGYRPHQTIEI